jgi:hypothetical protein
MSSTPLPVVSEPQVPAPQSPLCANCGALLAGEYCAACGQRHEPHVHTVGHFFGEAFESITHADSRLWRTLGFLLVKPGRLSHDFFQGRRAHYLPPFRLYLVISLLFFLVAGLPDPNEKPVAAPTADQLTGMNEVARALENELAAAPGAAQAAAAIRTEAAREAAAAEANSDPDIGLEIRRGFQENNAFTEFCEAFQKADPAAGRNYAKLYDLCQKTEKDRGQALLDALVHNIPRAMFVFLPLLALVMKLLYWRPRRFYVEHLLFLVHNHAFVFLALTILGALTRIPVIGAHLGLLEFAVWIYMIWYVFRAMRVYYQQSRGLTFAKYLTIGFSYLSTSLMVLMLTLIYSALTL